MFLSQQLKIYVEEIRKENLKKLKGLIFSQQVLMKLTSLGLERQRAYEMVQRNALRAWDSGREFKTLLLEDKEIIKCIPAEDIDNIFNVDYHLKHVDDIFERVFL